MGFSVAQFQAAINQINSGLTRVDSVIAQIGPAATAAVNRPNVPAAIKGFIIDLARKAMNLGRMFVQKIIELLKGSVAPILFFQKGQEWIDVRSKATGVQGQLKFQRLVADLGWKGPAADAYVRNKPLQADAAAKVAAIANSVSVALFVCAAAGLTFYLALGAIIFKFIAAMVACVAALGTAVFSVAGIALAIGEAKIDFGLIFGAIAALTGVLGAQAHQLGSLRAELGDGSAFPGGRWPEMITG